MTCPTLLVDPCGIEPPCCRSHPLRGYRTAGSPLREPAGGEIRPRERGAQPDAFRRDDRNRSRPRTAFVAPMSPRQTQPLPLVPRGEFRERRCPFCRPVQETLPDEARCPLRSLQCL